ncbi:MAG TPA: YceI family protein, partial [Ktedonobacterales bacterium]|nr:YceI family protein [Ktedonobacterales bacterium]
VGANPHNIVTGKTSSVQGTFLALANGAPQVAGVHLTITLASLKTDSAERDEQVSFIYLDTEDYPTAEFTSTCVRGLPATYQAGKPITFHLVGNLTMHGKSNAEDFAVQARLTGTTVTGTATATIFMTDFGISPPNFVDFDIVDNKTTVKLTFTATIA